MSVYKLSNVGGLKTKTAYTSFLAGNSQFVPATYEAIATTTLATSTANITFSSIPAEYTHLQIRGISRSTTSGNGSDGLYMQLNADTGSNYSRHYLVGGSGIGTVADGQTSQAFVVAGYCPRAGQLASCFGVSVIDILDYSKTNKNKTIKSLAGVDTNYTSSFPGYSAVFSGLWMNTSAITSIKLYSEANNLAQYSSFTLYGIRSI